MTRRRNGTLLSAAALSLAALLASASLARGDDEPAKTTKCEMTFSLKGWSAFYKTSSGEGDITCDNGQKAHVRISTKGGGATVGRSEIVNGTGKFTEVRDINEIFGSYANAEAHAGAGKSATAQVVTKGEISLALSGTGTGVDIGISFGKFTIEKAQ